MAASRGGHLFLGFRNRSMNMDQRALLQELFAKRASYARLNDKTEKSDNTTTLSRSINPAYIPTGKGVSLRALLDRTREEIQRKPPGRSSRKTMYGEDLLGEKAFQNGWYQEGYLKLKKYRVENLVRHWRSEMCLHFGVRCPELYSPPFWFRSKLLGWLRAEGHKHCEAAVSYAVEMWEPIRDRFEIGCEYPNLNVIWGFRQALRKEMEHAQSKKWGAHASAAEQYPDEVA
jgi:hypothetical protein